MLRAPRAFWHHPGHASDLTTACGLKVANLPPGALTPPSKIPTTCVKILANNSRLIAALATGSSADGLNEVVRRAGELRAEQAELQALVSQLGADFDALPEEARGSVLTALGLPPALADAATAAAEVSLRRDMESIVDPATWGDDGGAAELKAMGEEAEAMALRLEEGHPLPPMPSDWVVAPAEPVDQFLARMRASIADFEARVAGKKGRRRRAQEGQAGVELGESEWQGPFHHVPVRPKELEGVLPAPDLPPGGEQQWNKVQHVAYVLRRAHLQPEPTAPLAALAAQGLVSEEVEFEDPWVHLGALQLVEAYLERVQAAGGRCEVDSLFLNCAQFAPVRWQFVADLFLHLPLPAWYLAYLAMHSTQGAVGPASVLQPGVGSDASAPEDPAHQLYPRHEATQTAAEEQGTAHLPWMRWPLPLASVPHVWVANPLSPTRELPLLQGPGGILALGAYIQPRAAPRLDISAAGGRTHTPSYSMLPLGAILEAEDWYGASDSDGDGDCGNGVSQAPEQEPVPPPSLPRQQPMDLEANPMTPEEAEYLLKVLLGDKFEAVAAQLPKRGKGQKGRTGERGMAWRRGDTLTVVLTLMYDVDPEAGQVQGIRAYWDGVGGPFADVRHAYDVYLQQCGVGEWEEGAEQEGVNLV